ncbi:hypothetical protein XPA_003678 [Xanthoria parietina]
MLVDLILLLCANTRFIHATPAPIVPDGFQENQPPCQDYSSCGTKGHVYWEALIAKLTDANAVDVDRSQLFLDYYGTEPADSAESNSGQEVKQDLLNHGLSPLDQYAKVTTFSRSSQNGPEDDTSPYQNMYNTRDGIIICTYNWRAADSQKKLFWSDIAFHNYLQEMKPGESISTLRTIIRTDIINKGTRSVANAAYEAQPLDFVHDRSLGWIKWTLAEQPYFFYAFLGTDNVKGVVHLLTDHSVAIGKKVITEIWTRNDPSFDIWIELGPYSPQ